MKLLQVSVKFHDYRIHKTLPFPSTHVQSHHYLKEDINCIMWSYGMNYETEAKVASRMVLKVNDNYLGSCIL